MVRLRKPIGAGLMVVGVVCLAVGIAFAFALTQPSSVTEGGFFPLGIALAVLGALANVVGLFLPFSRRIGD
ncbi:MAG: hypothetical protein WD716_10930 [Fimbriimonadaceae bacterium]